MSTKRKGRNPASAPTVSKGPPYSAKKLWLFRIVAFVVAPLVFAGLLELSLRLSGYGYPTSFLLPISWSGRDAYVQNNQFGWRFFGAQMSRLPEALFLSRPKPPEIIRIFVFGESAAKGEPEPAFGLPRMLEAMLSIRHPGARFEVVNAAMTAINSHAILRIASDCAAANGDIWVLYMGNNEVVGPFGPGTVFGQQCPPLPVIRATLAAKATRTGQWLDAGLEALARKPAEAREWHGMEMFLGQQVRLDDPRMAAVYAHFKRNLGDILAAGEREGAGIVVSTVASNLKDCAPFGSTHRAGLSETEHTNWDRLYQLGTQAQEAGNFAAAAEQFAEAEKNDGSYAELRFRQATCELASGKPDKAHEDFVAARELDTLRFRCDTRLNELTRQAAAAHQDGRVLLADVERAFAEHSAEGLPGSELFYEHVHMTFKGNYLLAKAVAEQVEKLLPARLTSAGARPATWPSEADCARRLGWSEWSRVTALQKILERESAAPFTGQVNHQARMEFLTKEIEEGSAALKVDGLAAARTACETALATNRNDAVIVGRLAYLKQMSGDIGGAVALARHELELLPSDSQGWHRLGLMLVGQEKLDEASSAFRRAIELDPADVLSLQNLAQADWLLGWREEAAAEFRRSLKLQPNFAVAWLSLGQLLGEMKNAGAEDCFEKALTCRTSRPTDLVARARFCRSRGWPEAAVTNYMSAIALSPADTNLRLEAGELLLLLKRYSEASGQFAECVRQEPESARAHQLYGSALGQAGQAAGAEAEFREALRLAPELLEARLNLGIALMSQRRVSEARTCFEEVLQRSPTNELALKYLDMLRGKTESGK